MYMASIGLLMKQTLMLSSMNEPCHVFINHTHFSSVFLKFTINKAKKSTTAKEKTSIFVLLQIFLEQEMTCIFF